MVLDLDRLHSIFLNNGTGGVRAAGITTAKVVSALQHCDFGVPIVFYVVPQRSWCHHVGHIIERVAADLEIEAERIGNGDFVVNGTMKLHIVTPLELDRRLRGCRGAEVVREA